MNQEAALKELVDRLRKAYADTLVSVVLYGSAAAGDHQQGFSDLNILCILKRITRAELIHSESIFQWWRGLGNPAPLLLDEVEVAEATDCFPIEFHDIKERRRVLHGADRIEGLKIDDVFYRAQVEHELRSKLLRLRQKAAGVLSDKELLLRLMADSISTFAVLTRHALRLAGGEAKWNKREVFEQASEQFGVDAGPFRKLVEFRESKTRPKDVEPAVLFDSYLEQINKLLRAVNRLER